MIVPPRGIMQVLNCLPVAGGITQTFHDEIATELEKKQQELNDRLKLLTSDNKDFQVTASYLLDLAQRAEQLFNESDEGLRQKLLEYVLSNIELKDKKLSYILNDPFRTVVETKKKSLAAHNSNIWWSFMTKSKLILRKIAERTPPFVSQRLTRPASPDFYRFF